MPQQRFAFGPFTLDAGRGTLAREGVPLAVGHRALSLLRVLVEANGQVVTKAELIDAAWPRAVVEESNLTVQVAALRKLLGRAPDGTDSIATVARVGYRFCLPVTAMKEVGRPSTEGTTAFESGPSIAVLPLVNLSGDPQQEYFADGITEDIIMALSRFRWFRVIGRSGSFVFKGKSASAREVADRLQVRYVLEGSVRKSAERVRLSLQLIDAASQSQLWGERHDLTLGDIPALQDAIAEQIAGAIEPELLKTESAKFAARQPASDMTVQDLVHRGTWLFHRVDRASHLRARELFRQACKLDPAFGQAQFWLARVSAGLVAYGWSQATEADLEEGIGAAVAAIHADEKNPYAHYALAITSVFAARFDDALRAAERAVELAPGFALGHLVLGMARLYSGDAAGATASLSHGLRLNPFDPQNFVWYNTLAYAHLFAGQPGSALECSRRAQEVRPDWRPAVESAVCSLVLLGQRGEAHRCVERLSAMPAAAGDALWPLRRNNPDWNSQIEAWLRGAAEAASS
jgi:TolB-like protein